MSDVRRWLEAIGLAQYADAFEANGIDMDLLKQVDDQTLATCTFDHTVYEDTVGGVTSRWKGTGYVNLSDALVGALEFYETEFPKILA